MGVAFIVGVVFLIYSSSGFRTEYDSGDKGKIVGDGGFFFFFFFFGGGVEERQKDRDRDRHTTRLIDRWTEMSETHTYMYKEIGR